MIKSVFVCVYVWIYSCISWKKVMGYYIYGWYWLFGVMMMEGREKKGSRCVK